MNSSNYRFTLDLHKAQSQTAIPALLGDTSRILHINFTDGGVPYTIEVGCLAKITIRRPSGTYLEEFCEIKNNTTVIYHFSQNENTCAVEGIHECDVTLYDVEGGQVGSPRFSLIVSEKVIRSDDINLSDEDRSAVDAMVAAEASRQAAETGRVNAEAERVAAEAGRVDAEVARASAVGEIIEKANDALGTAENAAKQASAAADKAASAAEKVVSPEVTVTDIAGGHRVTVVDAYGAKTFDVPDGYDGVSPTISVVSIAGGHRMTITDVNGTKTFDVIDGANGEDASCKLPPVTDAEDGNILQVVDGVWTSVNIPYAEGESY